VNAWSCGGGVPGTGAGVETGGGAVTPSIVVVVSSTVAVGASSILAYGTNTIVPAGSPLCGCVSSISNALRDDPPASGARRYPQVPRRIGLPPASETGWPPTCNPDTVDGPPDRLSVALCAVTTPPKSDSDRTCTVPVVGRASALHMATLSPPAVTTEPSLG